MDPVQFQQQLIESGMLGQIPAMIPNVLKCIWMQHAKHTCKWYHVL